MNRWIERLNYSLTSTVMIISVVLLSGPGLVPESVAVTLSVISS